MPNKTEKIISGFYDGIFHFYEAANIFLTLGLIRLWRKKAARIALSSCLTGKKNHSLSCLDLCCGAGNFTAVLKKLSDSKTKITGIDFNKSMLSKASKNPNILFIRANAKNLPFEKEKFDIATISFAARNLNTSRENFVKILKEIKRVLKPGGVFINLETSRPENSFAHKIFIIYAKTVISLLCFFFPKNKNAYSFLLSSIASFYTAEELSKILAEAGFKKTEYSHLFFGAAAIHKAVKQRGIATAERTDRE